MPTWVEQVPRWKRVNAPAFTPGRVYLLLDLTASGGGLLGGAALVRTNPLVRSVGAGGVLAGGAADIDAIIESVSAGGVRLGGSGTVAVTIDAVAGSGGPLIGGAALLQAVWGFVGAGGAVTGGSATMSVLSVMTAAGGALVGGAADVDVLTDYEAIGGVLAGGAGIVAVTVDVGPHGGALAGGGAIFKFPETLEDYTGDLTIGVDGAGLIEPTLPRRVSLAGERRFTFRYELLDSGNGFVADLEKVSDGTVEYSRFADIRRKIRLEMTDGEAVEIDWLSDRVKPWVRLWLPPYGDDDYVEWPQGVFLLSTPTKHADKQGAIRRSVEGYDQLQVFLDDLIDDRYAVTAGTAYTTAVTALLGSVAQNVTTSAAVLPADMEWEPGTPKLKIINALLSAINYESLYFDENGTAVVKPYVTPADRATEYTYADDDASLIVPDVDQTLDLFSVPNKWVLVVSNPDQDVMTSTYTNDDPASPTSTVRRARTIVDFRKEQDAPDQSHLDAKVYRLAFEASQVYEHLEFQGGLMPLHGDADVYRIEYGPLALNSKFSAMNWTMHMKTGATMRHKARRVVSVG